MSGYFQNVKNPKVSVVLSLPLLVVYELGLLVVGWNALNGADFFTQALLNELGQLGFAIFNLVLIGTFFGAAEWLRRSGSFHPQYFGPLLIESAVYALSMGSIILFIMEEAHLLGGPGIQDYGVLTKLVLSAGAGLHEELVFRLGLIPLLMWTWTRIPSLGGELSALPFALIASSVLFSMAHFAVEAFEWFPFWYRTFAGLFFGLLFWFRGFAVACYTHFLYDVYVLLLA
jgi:membrane protease YdiL (CAAX protease family)